MNGGQVNNPLQVGYIRRYTLTEGTENGLRVIEIDNGVLRVLLNESKGLDIMQVWYKGVNMSFVSKNGFTNREIPFLNRFEGGMLYTCGLDSMGTRAGFEQHGTYHNTPAKVISLNNENGKLQVTAEMQNSALFGKDLMLKRTVTLLENDGKLLLEDTLLNRGTKTEDYCILYHVNLGYPMLDEGLEIIDDAEKIVPVDEHAEKTLPNRTVFSAPIDNEPESCYFLTNKTNKVSAVNKKLGKKFTLTYSKDTLPGLIQWHSPASHDYALGIEPATSFLCDGFEYRKVEPKASVDFFLELNFEDL
ncbi:MAG: DUF4432 family protein [Ruminococcaceae bacterium]|nr:DUF4432 family protein [Oscillospiraceae bacterium]